MMPNNRRCPVCNKAIAAENRLPFCSERCRLVDLEGWLNERYRIADDDFSAPLVDHDAAIDA